MADYKIGVLYGDGIGPEIVLATVEILEAAANRLGNTKFDWKELPIGWEGIKEYNNPVPDVTKEALKACHGWIMGPHDSVAYPKEHKEKRNPSGELRHFFDLYANVRPAKNIEGINSIVKDTDIVTFRENTEGLYPDRNMYLGDGEFMVNPETALSVGVFTKKAATRIAHAAFTMAMERRKKVTIVHKANVIKLGTGLFLNTCREVAKQYPEVQVDDYHIDAMTAHLVRRPQDFDVIVTTNMFGDIISDLAGELVGSLGLAPSINASDDRAMAQAAHGSAPDIAGQNIANPIGEILSAVMLLDWLGNRHKDPNLFEVGRIVEASIQKAIVEGVYTPDLGGQKSTTQFTEEVIKRMDDSLSVKTNE